MLLMRSETFTAGPKTLAGRAGIWADGGSAAPPPEGACQAAFRALTASKIAHHCCAQVDL